LTHVSRLLDDRLKRPANRHAAYVGEAAFAHKGGLHVSAVEKDPRCYEHIDPDAVGNRTHVVVSDQAGRSNLIARLRELGIEVGGASVMTVAEGNGPVNALDSALRQALIPTFPELDSIRLSDYKVRILTPQDGTKAVTRVMIETADGTGATWSTVGVSTNIIDASYNALHDSL